MTEIVPIRDTHMRYFELLLRHGNEEEKDDARETMKLMIRVKQEHPEGSWEPIEWVRLPGFLVERAERVGKQRHQLAFRNRLENKLGASRTLAEEIRTVEAQYACCLMLGFPFGDKLTWQRARKDGNIGQNVSAFTPRPGNFKLLIRETEKRTRLLFLMLWDGQHSYRCGGWTRAGAFMLPQYEQKIVRGEKVTHPYLVPGELLSPLRTWWE